MLRKRILNIMDTLTTTLVITDGQVDSAATVAAFETALEELVVQRDLAAVGISEAVAEIFAAHKGVAIAMPTLASLTAQKLGAVPENFKAITGRVLDYVRANTKGDNSLLVSRKGRAGGVSLRADAPVQA
jgi:hypothetical protein